MKKELLPVTRDLSLRSMNGNVDNIYEMLFNIFEK